MNNHNIACIIEAGAERFGAQAALGLAGNDSRQGRRSEEYTYEALFAASSRLAAAFREAGLQPNDRVALLGESRPRWGVAFFATLRAGGIALPLDVRQNVAELQRILSDAGPRLMLVASGQEALANDLLAAGIGPVTVLSFEPVDVGAPWPSMDALPAGPNQTCALRGADDAAVLTYTSGTTGNSKGVVTTHGNLGFQVRAIRSVMQNDESCSSVSILPLSHLFEVTAGFLGILYGGGRICYCNSLLPAEVIDAMRGRQVTCMVVVPLFLELIKAAIRNEVARHSGIRRRLFALLTSASELLPMSARRRLFAPIRRRFGNGLQYFVCGGAPLAAETERFFARIGLPVYQGYGLAETSPIISTNGPVAARAGSVGRPLPGIEIRISAKDGGEILTRGPHVMSGYFGDEELTRNLVDRDGWLHTGDLGYLDRNGFLYVSGRKKNVIVLGSGKKVQPEELEAVLFDHPDFQEGCVIGVPAVRGIQKGSEEVCAIVVASDAAIRRSSGSAADLELALRRVLEDRALALSPCKRPTRIIVRNEPLPRTSTRKVRRPSLLLSLQRGPVHS